MTSRYSSELLQQMIAELSALRTRALAMESSFAADVAQAPEAYRGSARNLLHYLELRQNDIRPLQRQLTAWGLSSLGRCEEYTLADIDAVLHAMYCMAGMAMPEALTLPPPVDFVSGPALLKAHTEALFGPESAGRAVRIMVTMPVEAASDYTLVSDLVTAGMDVMRINCAHDTATDWAGMAENLRRAQRESQRECRILVDLGGPKLRTGALTPGPQVVSWRPQRDVRGMAAAPARIWLTPAESPELPPLTPDAVLPLAGPPLRDARRGDHLYAWDCEGIRRELAIVGRINQSCWAESRKTVYIEAGAPVELHRGKKMLAHSYLGALPPLVEPLRLHIGDMLTVTTDSEAGHGPLFTPEGELLAPASIPCTLPEVFADVRPGERIFFDDGKIGGIIRSRSPERLSVEITQARERGTKLLPDKGINLPDSKVRLPALTEKDLLDLDFAVRIADIIGFSFVRAPQDVALLHEQLQQRGAAQLGIMLKIENSMAFENLPKLLLMGLRFPPLGIMVARGDLAVEMGYTRLAEVQEEILWFCEAAHVPVIWATQVLESLAQRGIPSRSEVTDAAMSERAECVMLNKGPHVVAAVRFLSDILPRMQFHQQKKRSMLRRLSVSDIRDGESGATRGEG
ncbi:MAG TPA: pyruvate kinase [Armatimonadota bacterium]|jgi:pyruvate kinase